MLNLLIDSKEKEKRLTLIAAGVENHMFLLILTSKEKNKTIYCFDSSGAFFNYKESSFSDTPNFQSLYNANPQKNGTCFYWIMYVIKTILQNTNEYSDIEKIQKNFMNIILDACIEMSKIFAEPEPKTIICQETLPDTNKYIRLGNSNYWLYKNYEKNKIINPDYLQWIQALKEEERLTSSYAKVKELANQKEHANFFVKYI